MKLLRRFAFLALLFGVATTTLFAENDPPSRVARLNYIQGKVSVQPGGVDDWVTASVNRPLTTSDLLWTDKDSRAELNLGTAAMRMNSETSLGLRNISDSTVQLELFQGTLNLRISHLYPGEIYEVDTPNMAFTVMKAGNYRFDVSTDENASYVSVWKGQGEATGNQPAVRVREGERMRFSGDRTLVHVRAALPPRDGFDDWCLVRDARERNSYALRYVSPGVIGYEDLDGYGSWEVLPTYGAVWYPVVGYGWAPYRYGHWIWVAPWGWTWVDDAPWGFAPFHYGRWIFAHDRWGWCPGPFGYRPYYAPALVAWVGGGNWGFGFGFGGGALGWFPLGWGDPFFPYYRGSRGYFRNINIHNTRITNITYITNNYYGNTNAPRWRYRNEQQAGAVTAVSRDTFVNARRVDTNFVAVKREQLRDAAMLRNPDLRPQRNSVLGLHADQAEGAPRGVANQRPVVSRLTPPPQRQRYAFDRAPAQPDNARQVAPGPANRTLQPRYPDAAARSNAPSQPIVRYPRPPMPNAGDRPAETPAQARDVPPNFERQPRYPRPPAAAQNDASHGSQTPTVDAPGRRPGPTRDYARGTMPAPEAQTVPRPANNDSGPVPRRTPQPNNVTVPRPPRDTGETPQTPRRTPQSSDNAVPRPQSNFMQAPHAEDRPMVRYSNPYSAPEGSPQPAYRPQVAPAMPDRPAYRAAPSPAPEASGRSWGYRGSPSPQGSAPRMESRPQSSGPASSPHASSPSGGSRGGDRSRGPH